MTSNLVEKTSKLAETAPNRAVFSRFEAVFPRKCFVGKELLLCHEHDTSKPCPRQDLRRILSTENRLSSSNTLSAQEIRRTARSQEKIECYTKFSVIDRHSDLPLPEDPLVIAQHRAQDCVPPVARVAPNAGFSDVVIGQQNLAQALQNYLAALSAQWQAVVDLASHPGGRAQSQFIEAIVRGTKCSELVIGYRLSQHMFFAYEGLDTSP